MRRSPRASQRAKEARQQVGGGRVWKVSGCACAVGCALVILLLYCAACLYCALVLICRLMTDNARTPGSMPKRSTRLSSTKVQRKPTSKSAVRFAIPRSPEEEHQFDRIDANQASCSCWRCCSSCWGESGRCRQSCRVPASIRGAGSFEASSAGPVGPFSCSCWVRCAG